MKKILPIALLFGLLFAGVIGLAACSSKADVASENLSKAADNFEIMRRIVFINGITDKYLLVIEGRCSLGNNDKTGELTVTCKIGANPDTYTKSFLGLSDNVTYMVEQLEPAKASDYHYRVNFRPETLVPDIRN